MAPYSSAAAKAVDYLRSRVLDEAWVTSHDDVAYYFKAPLAFLEAGDTAAAERALDIASRYAERGGKGSAGSGGAYDAMFPHYPWLWMCWGASRLDRKDLARQCFDRLWQYAVPGTAAGLVKAPYGGAGRACEADLFATSEVLKASLLVGRLDIAELAAATLKKALDANRVHMEAGRFYLRWDGAASGDGGGIALICNEEVFNCVCRDSPGQLYFMMAFPAMALLGLAAASPGRAEEYRLAALGFLDYLKGCEGVFVSPMAHKVGRAAAMAGDVEAAKKIADFLVSLQQETGCFQADPEAVDSLDQTAEIATWLFQIEHELPPEG